MKRSPLSLCARTLLWLALAGCTVQIQQTAGVPTSAPPAATPTSAPTATATAEPPSPTAEATETAADATGGPAATETAVPTATEIPNDWFGYPYLDETWLEFEVLTGWEDLGLEGSVLFLAYSEEGQSVVVFNFAVCLVTGLLFGIAPALSASRCDIQVALKDGSRGTTAGGSASRFRNALISAEVALALVLLVGAGLLVDFPCPSEPTRSQIGARQSLG